MPGDPSEATRPPLIALAGLLLLSGVVQAAIIYRSTLPSFDTVWFVNLAREIDRDGVFPAIASQREQPLFPVWLWVVHETVQRVTGPFRSDWAVSAQLAAAIALVLAVVPIYFLSVRLVGRRAGLVGALLFCLLPEVSRLGGDGISDSSHLLLFSLALWAILEYFTWQEQLAPWTKSSARLGSPMLLLAAGALTAAAVLARPEALVLLLALAVTLAAFQVQKSRRQPLLRLLAHACCLALGFASVYLPYLAAVGSLEPQQALSRATGTYRPPVQSATADPAGSDLVWNLADGRPMSFDIKEPTSTIRRRGFGLAGVELLKELGQLFGPWAGPLALFGLCRLQGRRPSAADRFAQVLLLVFTLLVLRHAAHEGYLSARHLLVWAVVGVGCAGYGAVELARLLTVVLRSTRLGDRAPQVAVASIAVLVVPWALWLAEPLHAGQCGHRKAAAWLASVATSPGRVFDTHGWTGLYSGRITYGPDELRRALGDPQLAYLVLESRELGFDSDRSRTLRYLIDVAAEPAAEFFRPNGRQPQQGVAIYRWHPDRFFRRLAMCTVGSLPTPAPASEERLLTSHAPRKRR